MTCPYCKGKGFDCGCNYCGKRTKPGCPGCAGRGHYYGCNFCGKRKARPMDPYEALCRAIQKRIKNDKEAQSGE